MTTTTQGRPATTGGAAHAATVNPDALADLIARPDAIEAAAKAEFEGWEGNTTFTWDRAGETVKEMYRDTARAALAALLDLARELATPDPSQHCFREDNCAAHPNHTGLGCCCCSHPAINHTGCDC